MPPGGVFGYTTDDIFYLETCLLNEICSNTDDLFSVDYGEPFECQFSEDGFNELQRLLLSGHHEPADATQCEAGKTCLDTSPRADGKSRSCNECLRVNDGADGDCSALPGCSQRICGFCTNAV